MNSITQLCTITGLRGRVIDKWLVGRALHVSQGDYSKLLSPMSILQKARSLQGDPRQVEASRVMPHRYALQRAYLRHLHEGKAGSTRPSSAPLQGTESEESRPNPAKQSSLRCY